MPSEIKKYAGGVSEGMQQRSQNATYLPNTEESEEENIFGLVQKS